MRKNLQKTLIRGALDAIRPLTLLAPDEVTTRHFFHNLGWDVAELLNADITSLLTVLGSIRQDIINIEQALDLDTDESIASFAALRSALRSTGSLLSSVRQLGSLNSGSATAGKFYNDVLQKLVTIYLFNNAETLYSLSAVAGIIEPDTISITENDKLIKYISRVPVFSFARLLEFLRNPKQRMADEYWPNGESDFATIESTHQIARKLLPRVVSLLNSLSIPAAQGNSNADRPFSTEAAATVANTLHLFKTIKVSGTGEMRLGLGAGLLAVEQGGPGVYIAPYGATNLETYVHDWLVQLALSAQIEGIVLTKNGTQVFSGNNTLNAGSVSLTTRLQTEDRQVLGNQTGTSLQVDSVQAGASFAFVSDSRTINIYLIFNDSRLVILPDEGDSFLKKVLPAGGITVKFNALLGWSSTQGFFFGGKVGFQNTIRLNTLFRKYSGISCWPD